MQPDQPTLPHTIQLLAPKDDSTTPPLQHQTWPDVKEQVVPEIQAIPNPRDYPERSRPRPVHFRWQLLNPEQNHARYDLLLATTPDFNAAQKLTAVPTTEAYVPHLLLNRHYYWKVVQYSAGEVVGESPVWSFQTHAAPPRWIHVPGISNVRDLGGWPIDAHRRVRQGMIFRSAEFNTHITLPPAGARVLVDELGIRTDLDLRGTAEDEAPAPALDNRRVDWQLCPLYAYRDIFTPNGKNSIRHAFHILADPERYPVLIHCWAGADRTGTLAFLINGLLGVSLDDLIHDYELTSLSIAGLRLHTNQSFQEILEGLQSFGPPDASIQQRVEAYLLSTQVTPAEIENIRRLLIETSA